jgi:hypothetical protein
MVEYSLGAGRAATSTAPAAGLGNSIKGAFDSVSKAIQEQAVTSSGSAAPGSSTQLKMVRPTRQSALRTVKKPTLTDEKAATYEDPHKIQAGIEYDEMIRRFGPPSMSVTTEAGTKAVSYPMRDGLVQVEVDSGKVISVSGADPAK